MITINGINMVGVPRGTSNYVLYIMLGKIDTHEFRALALLPASKYNTKLPKEC
jgi:hypothetical protein